MRAGELDVLYLRLSLVRARLDALAAGRVRVSVLERAVARFVQADPREPLVETSGLDRELDKVGVHTSADAKLLARLGVQKGRAGALAGSLSQRAVVCLAELEERIRRAERAVVVGELPTGSVRVLEEAFGKVGRIAKIADAFAAPEGSGPLEVATPPRARQGPPADSRLAVAEFLAERARTNVDDLVQRRRDLDTAHELLLRLGTAGERERARRLRSEVASAREAARGGAQARSLPALVRQVRGTMHKAPRESYRSLRTLYERAVEANETEVAAAAHAAVVALLPKSPTQLRELVGQAETDELEAWVGPLEPRQASETDDPVLRVALGLDDARLQTFELAAGCARYFDVEAAVATEDSSGDQAGFAARRQQRVPYPTEHLTFDFTGSLDELNNFVIAHPKLLVHDLASHRQLIRAYLADEPRKRPQKIKRTAVRVYVCDASGSMHGARAKFRDAILIAELANLRRKALAGQPFDPLYFSFFNDASTALTRVDSAAEANRQIEALLTSSPAEGRTDITQALTTVFDSVRKARGGDPYLARATAVLITDGEDGVDLEAIQDARAPLGGVEISLSFIALGEENADLRALVSKQREAGGRAFYHHLSDADISAARTEFDSPWRTLLPQEVVVTPADLEALVPHLEALEQIAAGRPATAVRPALSFERFFPPAETRAVGAPQRLASEDAARLRDMLEAVAEAVALAPIDERAGEAVELLLHLLGLYGWSVSRYLASIEGALDGQGRSLVAGVRLICRPYD